MASAVVKPRVTVEEYLAFERPAETRHEYRDGEIVAMPGASRLHNLIAGNFFYEIKARIRDQPCEVYSHDMRVCVEPDGLYTYPDVVAVCGEPRLLDAEQDTLLNPCLIVEVLSPSTEAYDRGLKFERYQRVESLREYVLVAQDRIAVERLARDGQRWVRTALRRPEDGLRLESIGCDVLVGAIYAKVALPASDDSRGA